MFIIQYSPLTIHCGRVQALNLHLHLQRYFAKIFFLFPILPVAVHDRSDTPRVVTATVVALGVSSHWLSHFWVFGSAHHIKKTSSLFRPLTLQPFFWNFKHESLRLSFKFKFTSKTSLDPSLLWLYFIFKLYLSSKVYSILHELRCTFPKRTFLLDFVCIKAKSANMCIQRMIF